MDPFSAGVDALFNSPLAVDAIYRPPASSDELPIRVIRSQPDRIADFGSSHIVQATNLLSIRKFEVAYPAAGATVEIIGAEMFNLVGDPRLDTEGLTWMVDAEPA